MIREITGNVLGRLGWLYRVAGAGGLRREVKSIFVQNS